MARANSRRPAVDRAMARVLITDRGYATPCWIFQGALVRGYGVIGHGTRPNGGNRSVSVHRLIYEHHNGPVPDGLQLDHLCRVRDCCNPAHLEPVTARENLLRSPDTLAGINAAKTHCVRGHELSGDNVRTYTLRTGSIQRQCRTCWHVRYLDRKRNT